MRIAAGFKSNGTLPDIYRHFQNFTEITDEQASALMQFELDIELKEVFPIMENLNLVRDGDLIVSDTYYDTGQIKKILEKIGLKKDLCIYATAGGKSSGKIWDLIKIEHSVSSHFGDSLHSDVASPMSRKIAAEHYSNSQLSPAEQEMMKMDQKELACLMRAVRLSNPYAPDSPEFALWNEQAQLNVPILVAASLYLNEFCQTHRRRRVLFTSRDGCLWIHIFRTLFPQYESIYFHASRYTYIYPTPSYISYVQSLYSDEAVIVDAHGKGTSCEIFFNKHLHVQPLYLAIINTGEKHHGILRKRELCKWIEMINYDTCGTLYDFQDGEAKRCDPEYDLRFIRPMHACIEKCREFLSNYSLEKYDAQVMEWAYVALRRPLVINRYVPYGLYHCHLKDGNEMHHIHLV